MQAPKARKGLRKVVGMGRGMGQGRGGGTSSSTLLTTSTLLPGLPLLLLQLGITAAWLRGRGACMGKGGRGRCGRWLGSLLGERCSLCWCSLTWGQFRAVADRVEQSAALQWAPSLPPARF